MELTLVRSRAAELDTDVVVLLDFEDAPRQELATPLAASYSSGEISGKLLEFTLLHAPRWLQSPPRTDRRSGQAGEVRDRRAAQDRGRRHPLPEGQRNDQHCVRAG